MLHGGTKSVCRADLSEDSKAHSIITGDWRGNEYVIRRFGIPIMIGGNLDLAIGICRDTFRNGHNKSNQLPLAWSRRPLLVS